ncbi:hypothetical protein AAF712_016561 [Marasmius tenuissimus]|uniref:Uncharacterized protein n=1 Tax=Marasmius tenuissimus TaxID=585030 RepID=A0ABR2Z6E9_9AGAR
MPSQSIYMQTRALQDQIKTKVKGATLAYQTAREALLVLMGPGEWMDKLQELKDDNIRGITEHLLKDNEKEELRQAQERAGYSLKEMTEVLETGNVPTAPLKHGVVLGQSNLNLSWIWYTHMPLMSGSDLAACGEVRSNFEELQESLRAEWCKARARSHQSCEEIRLIEEEMRRAIDYCGWQSQWWLNQISRHTNVPDYLHEGLVAYAKQHTDEKGHKQWSGACHGRRSGSKRRLYSRCCRTPSMGVF